MSKWNPTVTLYLTPTHEISTFYAIVYLTSYMGLQLVAWIKTYLPLHEDGVSADRYTIDISRGLWRCWNIKSPNIKDRHQHSGDLILHFPRRLRQTEELTTWLVFPAIFHVCHFQRHEVGLSRPWKPRVRFTRVNKIEAVYTRLSVNVKVEPRLTQF